MEGLLSEIRGCTICEQHLPFGCRPVLAADKKSKIAIIGQAPGSKVHQSGVPWQDKSGDTLRQWLGVGEETFYTPEIFALIPMGFCYPGSGKSGDLPPRKECAPQWHPSLLEAMQKVKLTLLVGSYAQKYYLGRLAKRNLTETVKSHEDYLPDFFPLPHPSPRNNIWRKRNPWFAEMVLPALIGQVGHILGT